MTTSVHDWIQSTIVAGVQTRATKSCEVDALADAFASAAKATKRVPNAAPRLCVAVSHLPSALPAGQLLSLRLRKKKERGGSEA